MSDTDYREHFGVIGRALDRVEVKLELIRQEQRERVPALACVLLCFVAFGIGCVAGSVLK